MRLMLVSALTLACLAPTAFCQEDEPAPTHAVFHPLRLPPYLIVGWWRDLIDAPVKGLSSIPVFNRILMPPLAILNAFTSLTCWSFTPDGISGGFEAWVACLDMPRKGGKPRPVPMQRRPGWKNYFPNLRGLGVVTHDPAPD